ncbi:Zinc finger FYVE domain-containing protein 26 isoform 1 [Spatholobus suberectus]|nr:Zinc finger FYVE domain-containing protein 26 isoform 1 [Spatholobus suberectus]
MAEAKSRDARRRRRILEQGSDRLAFISGRIQTLPDSPSSSQSQPHDPNTTLPAPVDDSDSTSQNREPYNHDASNAVIQTPPKGESEISSVPSSEPEPEPEPVQVQPPPPQAVEPKRFIIPSDITHAIDASKGTRLCCSVLVALLVLASYPGFSFLGSKFFKTVIGFRPLYLVLVTNLTAVIARLFSCKQRGFERRQSRGSSGGGGVGGDEYAQLAKALELCLVVQNAADAVFMDCAVYAVVLVCGLALLHT